MLHYCILVAFIFIIISELIEYFKFIFSHSNTTYTYSFTRSNYVFEYFKNKKMA